MVGNKLDLEDKRQVSYEEGKNFADENDLLFFESAILLVDKIENKEIKLDLSDNGIKINNSYEDEDMIKLKNKKKCC